MKSTYSSYDGFFSHNEKEYHKHTKNSDVPQDKILSKITLTVSSSGINFSIIEHSVDDTRLNKRDFVLFVPEYHTHYHTDCYKMGELSERYSIEVGLSFLGCPTKQIIADYKIYMIGKAIDYMTFHQFESREFNTVIHKAEQELEKLSR